LVYRNCTGISAVKNLALEHFYHFFYGMYTISVRTAQNVFIHYPVASIGDRILAHLLDQLIKVLYVIVLFLLFISAKLDEAWIIYVLFALPIILYTLIFEIFMNGQTPGKRALNIQVVRLDGTPPSMGGYVIRWMFSLLEFTVSSGIIAVITVLVTGKGQRLGDVVAGTSVVKLIKQEVYSSREVFVSTDDAYQPTFSQVIALSEKDIELIQQALEVNRIQDNSKPMLMATDRVKSLLGIQSDMPPVKFLYTIVKDYQHFASK
jgi:uncharacterized RDD family membrane protein YckC